MQRPMPLEFGPYRVVRSLGKGGFGEVFEVVHGETGVRYALKSITAFQDQEDAERFQREAEAMARLDHPNVAQIHSADLQAPRPYLVQELLTGGDLAARIQRGPLALEEAVRLSAQVAEGLAAVHAQGILHRDLKPENVLLDAAGVPKLVDFGLARLEDRTQLTETHSLMGTPSYMSPEQAQGVGVEVRSDVYSLTALFYALLTGEPPFAGRGTLLGLLHAVVHDPPPRPSQVRPGTPAWVDQFVIRGLAKDPAGRPADARAFARALVPPAREPSPSRAPLWVVAIFVLVGALVGVVLLSVETDEAAGVLAPRTPSVAPDSSPRSTPSQPPPAPLKNGSVLRGWSQHATSAWLFDSASLVALDSRGRALRYDLVRDSRTKLFSLRGAEAEPEEGRTGCFFLAPYRDSWTVGVQTFPIYRGDMTQPLPTPAVQRALVEWRGGLYFSADDQLQSVFSFESSLKQERIPASADGARFTVEGLLPGPDARSLFVMTGRRLLEWNPGAKPIDYEPSPSQSDFSALAVSAEAERVYLGTRGGRLLSRELWPEGRPWRPWRDFPLPSEGFAPNVHKGSVRAIVVTSDTVYSLADHGDLAIEVKAWNLEATRLLGSFSFKRSGGAINLAIDPLGRQLAIGLVSGGVRLLPVSKLLDSK